MNAPVRWIKSSFSTNNGACVEMAWIKSSYSANNGTCVEVAATPSQVAARDSKNADGPVLLFTTPAWTAFVTEVSGHR